MLFKVLSRAAMMIPIGVIQLNKANSSFHESSCQETISSKRSFLRIFYTVEVQCFLGLSICGHQLRRTRLHLKRHFVSVDSGGNLRIAGLSESLRVEFLDRINNPPLHGLVNAGRIRQIQNRIPLVA